MTETGGTTTNLPPAETLTSQLGDPFQRATGEHVTYPQADQRPSPTPPDSATTSSDPSPLSSADETDSSAKPSPASPLTEQEREQLIRQGARFVRRVGDAALLLVDPHREPMDPGEVEDCTAIMVDTIPWMFNRWVLLPVTWVDVFMRRWHARLAREAQPEPPQ